MKRSRLTILFLCSLLIFFCGSASALTINSGAIEVGDIDDIYATTSMVPGYENQLAWIHTILGDGYSYFKYDISASSFTPTDTATGTDSNVWALDLYGTPEYYFIKLGMGGPAGLAENHWLYENRVEMAWAVIDISDWGVTASNIDIGRISHVGEVGSAIPEPSTMILLGSGLLGLAGLSRTLRRKA
jgi:hypothetical protein